MTKIKIYNTHSPDDRKVLADRMLDWNDDQILATRDRMFKLGYRGGVSDMDVKMFHYLKQPIYDNMSRGNFVYSCLEADYINLDKQSPMFHKLCQSNRDIMWDLSRDIIVNLLEGNINTFDISPESEMLSHIKAKHQGMKLEDFLKSLQ